MSEPTSVPKRCTTPLISAVDQFNDVLVRPVVCSGEVDVSLQQELDHIYIALYRCVLYAVHGVNAVTWMCHTYCWTYLQRAMATWIRVNELRSALQGRPVEFTTKTASRAFVV